MEVHFTPDLQAKLDRLVTETGRSAGEFVLWEFIAADNLDAAAR